ncbi:hypothetical protein F4678DRAFT_457212 [Xylaria arbuscula]|nr:hypothetical protein F4678DRAFT_457212 [Xylaria arbuscula]
MVLEATLRRLNTATFLAVRDAQRQPLNAFLPPPTARSAPATSSISSQARLVPDPGPNFPSPSWAEQAINDANDAFYFGAPFIGPEATMADLTGEFPIGIADKAVDGFNGGYGDHEQFSLTPTTSVVEAPASDSPFGTPNSTGHNEYISAEDPASQLTSLRERTLQAIRRLDLPGREPLTVSSPEVNVALDDTNTLTCVIDSIIARDQYDDSLDATTTDCGLVFLALACHQQLIVLLRALFNDIHQCLQAIKEHKGRHQSRVNGSSLGPSSVAQFVMVLQLLIHLTNRIDRSLFQGRQASWQCSRGSADDHITPLIAKGNGDDIFGPIDPEDTSEASGLMLLAHKRIGMIPKEHERLRQDIQQLQTEMERPR